MAGPSQVQHTDADDDQSDPDDRQSAEPFAEQQPGADRSPNLGLGDLGPA